MTARGHTAATEFTMLLYRHRFEVSGRAKEHLDYKKAG